MSPASRTGAWSGPVGLALMLAGGLGSIPAWSAPPGDPVFGQVRVEAPTPNQQVVAGAEVTVRLRTPAAMPPATLLVMPPLRAGIEPLVVQQAPYEGRLRLPRSYTGTLPIEFVLRDEHRHLHHLGTVVLQVVAPPGIVRLTPDRSSYTLYLGGPEASGEHLSLHAEYADGTRLRLDPRSHAMEFHTLNPGIVIVTDDGTLQPVAPGVTLVAARHGRLLTHVPVTVHVRGRPTPPWEHTGSVYLEAGPLRPGADPWHRKQTIVLRNDAPYPLPMPLTLVLSGLPPGTAVSTAPDGKELRRTRDGRPSLSLPVHGRLWGTGGTLTIELLYPLVPPGRALPRPRLQLFTGSP